MENSRLKAIFRISSQSEERGPEGAELTERS